MTVTQFMSAVRNDGASEQHLQLENWQKKPSRRNVAAPVEARLLNTSIRMQRED